MPEIFVCAVCTAGRAAKIIPFHNAGEPFPFGMAGDIHKFPNGKHIHLQFLTNRIGLNLLLIQADFPQKFLEWDVGFIKMADFGLIDPGSFFYPGGVVF